MGYAGAAPLGAGELPERDHGRRRKVEGALRVAVTTAEASHGAGSEEVAAAVHDLGVFLGGAGQIHDAAMLYERSLGIRRELFGPGHPRLAMTLHNLALLYERTGRSEEADQLWAEADQAAERVGD